MMRNAGDIDLVGIRAATGEADVGFPRLAGSVNDTPQHTKRHRRTNMLQPLLQRLDRADHVETLPRA